MAKAHRTWFGILGTIYLVLWVALAIAPEDRAAWALENLLAVVLGGLLFATRRSFTFSRVSYCLWFAFFVLHAIGGHFTYAKVPYDAALADLVGWSPQSAFGWQRNNYDRLVHFCYGLLLAYPAREIALRIASARGFWGYAVPWLMLVATSAIFELFEWGAAWLFGEQLGMTYLGTQGDPWDAQKDIALATLGALIAMGVTALLNARLQRDFAREWAESVRVKRKRPLGEDAVLSGRA